MARTTEPRSFLTDSSGKQSQTGAIKNKLYNFIPSRYQGYIFQEGWRYFQKT